MSQEITVREEKSVASTEILSDFEAFENAQRIGKVICQSGIIPQSYQNNLPNVIVALEIAARNKLSPIVVMQNLNVIKGRPTWSSKYIIAALTTARVDNLHYELAEDGNIAIDGFGGKTTIKNLMCRAIATDRKSGEERIGPWVSMKMAVDEGWYGKDGSKWKTMPDMMIRYRAATFFASIYYPELSIGIDDEDSVSETVRQPEIIHEQAEAAKIAEPQPEAPAKPKRSKKAEVKPEVKAEEKIPLDLKKEDTEAVDAEFEEVQEEIEKPEPVVMPQSDDSDEWDNWGE